MTQYYQFTLDLSVHDPEQLLAAALAHPGAADNQLNRVAFLGADGSVDVDKCLVMLLDPGTLAGGEIIGSSSEELEIHNVDFGDERN